MGDNLTTMELQQLRADEASCMAQLRRIRSRQEEMIGWGGDTGEFYPLRKIIEADANGPKRG